MKKLLMGSILLLICQTAYAEDPPPETVRVCSNQAREVMLGVYTDVLPDMTAEQRGRLMQIANDACLKHIANPRQLQTAGKVPAEAVEEKNKEETGGDWFTDYILKSQGPEKEGNKRLKNLKR